MRLHVVEQTHGADAQAEDHIAHRPEGRLLHGFSAENAVCAAALAAGAGPRTERDQPLLLRLEAIEEEQWEHAQEHAAREDPVCRLIAEVGDQLLRNGIEDHAADARAGQGDAHRRSLFGLEPVVHQDIDRHHAAHGRANADHEAQHVELPDAPCKRQSRPRHGHKQAAEDGDAVRLPFFIELAQQRAEDHG